MPTGWGYFYRQGSNLQIVNNRLEVGQVNTSGGIYRPFDPTGVSKVQIDYDANIANVSSGQSNAAMLLKNPTNLEAGYAYAGAAKSGFGQNTMLFYADLQNPGGPYSRIISNVTPAVFGNYHISTTFQDGFVSLAVTPFGATTPIFSSGLVTAPGFQLSAMSNLALFGITTTGTSAWIDNAVITTTTTAPTCTPPQVLQGNVCMTPAPSALILARLSEDVYNRNKTGNQGTTGFNFIAGKSVYIPIRYVAQVPELVNSGSTPAYVIPPVKEDAVAINVYQNSADSHQYVLAVKGTSNAYDLIADGSFITGGKANSELILYANLLASKISAILAVDPNASITLTGHSMGGAIAQVVGSVGNFPVVSFDAPGVGDVLSSMRSQIAISLGGFVVTGSTAPVTNYRLYGDQVSFAGTPLSNSITKTVANVSSTSVIDAELLPMGWLDNHSMPTLLSQLEKALGSSCIPALCVQIESAPPGAEGSGRNITDDVIFPAIKVAPALCVLATISNGYIANRGYCLLAALSNRFVQNVIGGAVNFVDPGPGWVYSLEFEASSPQVRSISLPFFGDVFGWALRYQDQAGWSSDNILTSKDSFSFLTDIRAMTFVPLDIFGNPMYNVNPFIYDLTFAQTGEFSGIQTAYGILQEVSTVPEPNTIFLLMIGGFAYMLAFRRKHSLRGR